MNGIRSQPTQPYLRLAELYFDCGAELALKARKNLHQTDGAGAALGYLNAHVYQSNTMAN